MISFEPAYINTAHTGSLDKKIKKAHQLLRSCTLCPRECKVNRLAGETGVCKTAEQAFVSSYSPHFGEEAPLVGKHGSGTIFFTHCNLMCCFCQNYDISHEGIGSAVSDSQLAKMMLNLQEQGCHNINFVTPSHVVPQILSALEIAIGDGLNVPLVYNTSGYDQTNTLRLLEGVIDIYMPDFKFWDPTVGLETCGVEDYPERTRQALIEMHRQVGDLVMDDRGVAQRGLLVRHLVLPKDLSGTQPVMRFIARHISTNSYVNIMPQYRPCGTANRISGLSTAVTSVDYERAMDAARKERIRRLDKPRRVFEIG